MKSYSRPEVRMLGKLAELTATLGNPGSGDTSFDVDGEPIEEGAFSVDQCPTTNQETCV